MFLLCWNGFTFDTVETNVTDVSALSDLKSLTKLDLSGNGMEINFNESTTTAGKNANVIRDLLMSRFCIVEYEKGNTVTITP